MENKSKKPTHLSDARDSVQYALNIIEVLQRLSLSRSAGGDKFTLWDSRSTLDRAAVYLYDARSAIERQMALDDGEA